ncbi:MAG TPA: hypothetical protein VIF83_10410 [Gemmatimonadaceae bacterium]|jgi:hypothetical protein
MRSPIVTIAISVAVAACTRAPLNSEDTSATPRPGSNATASASQQSDWAAIEKLEQQAKGITKASGCSSSSDCRAAAVGSRACGGPRYYVTYCARSTDSAALYSKLDEVAAAEKAYNAKYQLVSTCEFRMPPTVESEGGVCTAK